MITRTQLKKLHKEKLPLHILEQDYIQALILIELYNQTESLVFKGGTLLKHAYGLDRYSEDLDFTQTTKKNHKNTLKKTTKKLLIYGIEAELKDTIETKQTLKTRLSYQGPLYTGLSKTKGRVEIEISKRNDILLGGEWTRLFFKYPEASVVNCLSMKKPEIMAEKLRALSMREKPRDLYDIWYLMKQGVNINEDLYWAKMKAVKINPEIKITIDEKQWNQDLNNLLEKPPPYKLVEEEIKKEIRKTKIRILDA